MKNKAQMFVMGCIVILTVVLILSVFAGQLNMETKASEKGVKECMHEEDKQTEDILKESGKEDEEQEANFVCSEPVYFEDALFIGDSRTVGLCEYGTLKNADYFASTGMSIYKLWDEIISVEDAGKVSLKELLELKNYKKVYIMLGINELGYKFENTVEKYEDTISKIRESEKDVIIYVCANLHVTMARSDKDKLINNKNIDVFNQKLKALTDNKMIYYIDVNKEFDDENGNLRAECTGDDVHVYAKYYQDWSNWLCENTVQRGN